MYKKSIGKNLRAERATAVERILLLLTESGAVYCLIWVRNLDLDCTFPSDPHAPQAISIVVILPIFKNPTVPMARFADVWSAIADQALVTMISSSSSWALADDAA
jgi:hypothetical protein